MQRRRNVVFPRIIDEIVNVAELMKVWNCSYMMTNRIMYGRKVPNHVQKKQLSEYLGIPVEELFYRVQPDVIPKDYVYPILPKNEAESQTATPLENSEIISESDEGGMRV